MTTIQVITVYFIKFGKNGVLVYIPNLPNGKLKMLQVFDVNHHGHFLINKIFMSLLIKWEDYSDDLFILSEIIIFPLLPFYPL